jgi:hypothetical protein
MSQRWIAGLMIVLGAMMMATGMFMDVTVASGYGDVVNLHKVSQQQSLLIVGGVIFLSGMLVLGFWRLKQTTEDEIKSRVRAKETQEKLIEGVAETGRATGALLVGFRAKFITKAEGLEKIALRIITALFSVWLIQLYGPEMLSIDLEVSVSDPLFSVILFGTAIAYSLLARPTYVVISHLLFTNIAFSVLCVFILVYVQSTLFFDEHMEMNDLADLLWVGSMLLANIIVTSFFLYRVRSKRLLNFGTERLDPGV